jgi:hypothetical protein
LILPLSRRGLIGDQGSAALSGADGTIDWWCPERFDARPALAGLLDPDRGTIRTAPVAGRGSPVDDEPGYDPETNIVRTTLAAGEGTLEIVDFLPWAGPGHTPPGRLVRLVTALAGRVEVTVAVEPGRDGWSEGVAGPGFTVHTGFPMVAAQGDSPHWRGSTVLETGQRLVVTVDPTGGSRPPPAPLTVGDALRFLGETTSAWRSQVGETTVEGPYRDAVERSLLVVRALTSAAGGGMVRAPTASLPEQPGGERNFDGRVCFTADAALAANVLDRAGLAGAAADHGEWLAGLLRAGDLPLAAAHTPEGGPPEDEEELSWPGYLGSQPVRFGWSPPDAPDLAGMAAVLRLGDPDRAWAGSVELADWLASHWGAAPLVADRLAVAAALDRMTAAARRKNPLDLDAAGWQQEARAIRAWVEGAGMATGSGLRRDASPADDPDAELLAVAWLGPWPPGHPVVERTVERVLGRLSQDSGLVERYPPEVDDGLPPGRPPGMAVSFAAVRALAATGRWDEAHGRMEMLCGLLGPFGLAGDAADPRTGEPRGNYPSAAAHLALVDAALALAAGPR